MINECAEYRKNKEVLENMTREELLSEINDIFCHISILNQELKSEKSDSFNARMAIERIEVKFREVMDDYRRKRFQ